MTDVSLDDLIKKDRDTAKAQRVALSLYRPLTKKDPTINLRASHSISATITTGIRTIMTEIKTLLLASSNKNLLKNRETAVKTPIGSSREEKLFEKTKIRISLVLSPLHRKYKKCKKLRRQKK